MHLATLQILFRNGLRNMTNRGVVLKKKVVYIYIYIIIIFFFFGLLVIYIVI